MLILRLSDTKYINLGVLQSPILVVSLYHGENRNKDIFVWRKRRGMAYFREKNTRQNYGKDFLGGFTCINFGRTSSNVFFWFLILFWHSLPNIPTKSQGVLSYWEGARGHSGPFWHRRSALRPILTSALSAQTLSFRSALQPYLILALSAPTWFWIAAQRSSTSISARFFFLLFF